MPDTTSRAMLVSQLADLIRHQTEMFSWDSLAHGMDAETYVAGAILSTPPFSAIVTPPNSDPSDVDALEQVLWVALEPRLEDHSSLDLNVTSHNAVFAAIIAEAARQVTARFDLTPKAARTGEGVRPVATR